jgi:pSer/pThr/pTyr-binding forkhead associated (FHA) protein
MPRLTLKFDDRIINQYAVDAEVTIGRLPDNTVVIDNPAVSGHHARVFLDGEQVVLEDLRSRNGTYVNDQHVVRATLKAGDVVLIGKHRIEYDETNDVAASTADGGATAPTMGATRYLDTRQHRAMLARLREARAARDHSAATTAQKTATGSGAPKGAGVLRVLAGAVEAPEYTLQAQSAIIGKSESALVRLRGWFKPHVAATIGRDGATYFVTASTGRVLVNGEHLDSRRELRDGDVLDVAGVVLEFRLKRESSHADPHPNVA